MICIARTFGRARDGPRREARAQEVERADPVAQLADDLRDEVGHVREALRLHEPLDPHGPRPADAREVVAAEVDEHHVLGAVLLGGEQALRVAGARRGRPGDRVEARAPSLDLDERLRRRADQGELAELEQEEVRRGVDAAEGAVELERARRGRPLRPLREDDLEGVARADVLLARRPTARTRRPGNRRVGRPSSPRGSSGGRVEERAHLLGVAVEHLGDAAGVVEADEGVGDDEEALRQVRAVGRELGRSAPAGRRGRSSR